MKLLANHPKVLSELKKSPERLFYKGDPALLEAPMVSIVGTRRPRAYTKERTTQIARAFSQIGYVVVSGAAMGVDALAHRAAFPRTVAVMANSLDIHYPAVNRTLIQDIYEKALALSEYEGGTRATRYSFVVRNRIVVALGAFLIITEADESSGTMRSAQIATALGKKIYVLPHRLGESEGTQCLLREGLAEPIYDIDAFVAQFGQPCMQSPDDPLLAFCQNHPTVAEAVERFGDRVYSYELEGKVTIKNLKVYPA